MSSFSRVLSVVAGLTVAVTFDSKCVQAHSRQAMKAQPQSVHRAVDMPQRRAVACYNLASGVIALHQAPVSGRKGIHGGGFAPIGEAVFRAGRNVHVCPGLHARRG